MCWRFGEEKIGLSLSRIIITKYLVAETKMLKYWLQVTHYFEPCNTLRRYKCTAIHQFLARHTIFYRLNHSITHRELTNLRHRQRNWEAVAVYLWIIRWVSVHVTNPALTYRHQSRPRYIYLYYPKPCQHPLPDSPNPKHWFITRIWSVNIQHHFRNRLWLPQQEHISSFTI